MINSLLPGRAFVLIMVVLAICIAPIVRIPPEYGALSVYDILANPTEYDGKEVRVSGVCNVEFEAPSSLWKDEPAEKGVLVPAYTIRLGPGGFPAGWEWSNEWVPLFRSCQAMKGGRIVVTGTFVIDKSYGSYTPFQMRNIKSMKRLPD